tara:strand:- start:145 stop:486 length:342 start_codon:yes stop_codon:yes gene_type:complete
MGNGRKPWLKYKNPEKPAREYHSLKPKRRTVQSALFFLIFTGGVGGHKFYLGRMKQGWWLFVIYHLLFIFYRIAFDSNPAFVIGVYFLLVFLLEVGSLNKQVKLRNIELGCDD